VAHKAPWSPASPVIPAISVAAIALILGIDRFMTTFPALVDMIGNAVVTNYPAKPCVQISPLLPQSRRPLVAYIEGASVATIEPPFEMKSMKESVGTFRPIASRLTLKLAHSSRRAKIRVHTMRRDRDMPIFVDYEKHHIAKIMFCDGSLSGVLRRWLILIVQLVHQRR
jgi:hypothetical protein